jgi:hypothetical protein
LKQKLSSKSDGVSESEPASKRTKKSSGSQGNAPENPKEDNREKFLERNRIAASKCRQRKKAWTQEIEKKSLELSEKNKFLKEHVSALKEEVMRLKNLLLGHHNCDCKERFFFLVTSLIHPRR